MGIEKKGLSTQKCSKREIPNSGIFVQSFFQVFVNRAEEKKRSPSILQANLQSGGNTTAKMGCNPLTDNARRDFMGSQDLLHPLGFPAVAGCSDSDPGHRMILSEG
jgi:hypothetical protein